MTAREGGLPERWSAIGSSHRRYDAAPEVEALAIVLRAGLGDYEEQWSELASGTREAMEAALRLLGGKDGK